MEMCAVKLCIPDISSDASAIMARLERLEGAVREGKAAVCAPEEKKEAVAPKAEPETKPAPEAEAEETLPPPPPPAPVQQSAVSQDEDILFTGWGEVLEKLNVTDKPLLGILGVSSAYIRGEFLLIKCDNPVFSQFIRQGNHANAIKAAVFEVTGRKYRLGIYKSDDSNARSKDPLADLVNKINNL